jgi:hypothetical protein
MPTLNLRGAYIRYLDVRPKEGMVLSRLHMTADFSDTVCGEMGWGHELKDQIKDSAGLEGLIGAGQMVLTPNSRDLKTHEMQFAFHEVRDFKLHIVTGEDGETSGAEVRFVLVSAAPQAAELTAAWFANIGTGEPVANLRLRYAEQAKITEEQMQAAKDAEPGDDARQGVLPDISITGGHGRGRKRTAEVQ